MHVMVPSYQKLSRRDAERGIHCRRSRSGSRRGGSGIRGGSRGRGHEAAGHRARDRREGPGSFGGLANASEDGLGENLGLGRSGVDDGWTPVSLGHELAVQYSRYGEEAVHVVCERALHLGRIPLRVGVEVQRGVRLAVFPAKVVLF